MPFFGPSRLKLRCRLKQFLAHKVGPWAFTLDLPFFSLLEVNLPLCMNCRPVMINWTLDFFLFLTYISMWFSLCFQVDKAHPDVLTVLLQLFDEVMIESLGEREGERKAGKRGGG